MQEVNYFINEPPTPQGFDMRPRNRKRAIKRIALNRMARASRKRNRSN